MLNIAVCDDMAEIGTQIEKTLRTWAGENAIKVEVDVFTDERELLSEIEHGNVYDLLFLDVELKTFSGVEVGRRIREDFKNNWMQIVYISAEAGHAMELFELQPLNFLIKPIRPEVLVRQVEKAIQMLNRVSGIFQYKRGHAVCRQEIKKIYYFESEGRQVKMVTNSGDVYFYGKLSKIYEALEQYRFLFINQSFLVNQFQVVRFRASELMMPDKKWLPISQSRRKKIKELQLQFEKEGFL